MRFVILDTDGLALDGSEVGAKICVSSGLNEFLHGRLPIAIAGDFGKAKIEIFVNLKTAALA